MCVRAIGSARPNILVLKNYAGRGRESFACRFHVASHLLCFTIPSRDHVRETTFLKCLILFWFIKCLMSILLRLPLVTYVIFCIITPFYDCGITCAGAHRRVVCELHHLVAALRLCCLLVRAASHERAF